MIKAALERIGRFLARPFYQGVGSILALHRVAPEAQRSRLDVNRALEITPEDLDTIIRLLQRQGFEFIAMDEVLTRLSSRETRRFVTFTLDDGYRDNVEHALPVFERHSIPFTIYATRGFSEYRDSIWWFSLEEALTNERITIHQDGREQVVPLPNQKARETAFTTLARRLRACRLEERDQLIAEIFGQFGIDPLHATRALILSPDELAKLSQHPLATIGAHTVHHLTSKVLDDSGLRAEFAISKTWLEGLCGKMVPHLAYPFGGANAVGRREFAIAQACGFATAVTTRFANLFPAHRMSPWAIPRLEISGNYPVETFVERAVSGLLPAIRNRGRRVVTV